MFEAQTIYMQGGTATTLKGPWQRRGADFGRFTLELVNASSTSSGLLMVTNIFHKNESDAGEGALTGSGMVRTGANLASAPRVTVDYTAGFKELWRYVFVIAGTGTDWAQFRMLEPVWYDELGG